MSSKHSSKTKLKRKISELTAAHEVGKIFNAILDHEVLLDFFLLVAARALHANAAVLYSDKNGDLVKTGTWGIHEEEEGKDFTALLEKVKENGRPLVSNSILFIPLIIRDKVTGVACFKTAAGGVTMKDGEIELAMAYANQAAGAIKNLELYEENLKYEKLAAIGQTISVLSHEVKNILQCIRTSEYIVDKGLEAEDLKKMQEGWVHIKKNNERLNDFVLNMLRLTKDRRPVCTKIALTVFLKDLVEDVQERASRAGINLSFNPDEKIGEVYIDPQGIYSTVLNLIINAIEACKEGSSVEVSTKLLSPDRFEIRVSDTGSGIPPENMRKIFEIFYSTKGSSGTGLGLALVEKTIREHNGTIRVESEPGKGTTFIITLPVNM